MEIILRPVNDLKNYDKNARTHSAEQVKELSESIKTYGFLDPIEVTKDLVIISGHARLAAAVQLGLTHVPTICHEHLDKTHVKGYTLAANRIALSAGWDAQILGGEFRELKDDGFDLKYTGFTQEEIDAYLNPKILNDGLVDPDDCDAVAAGEPVTKLGDIWLLGTHRLMCGDSTMIDTVEALMAGERADMVFTDPPYGVNYTGGAKKREALANDQIGTEIYGAALPNLQIAAKDHAALYLWYADAHASSAAAAAAAAAAGYIISAQIIWVKNNAQFVSAAKYHGKHEPCFYAHRKGRSAQWFGGNNEVTVWEIDRNHKNEFHPTQKPTALAERAINNSSKSNQIVLDLFGGSGSTLIACEKTGRKCYMMELAPQYCDVIVKRWQKFTGGNAILESTGETFDGQSEEK